MMLLGSLATLILVFGISDGFTNLRKSGTFSPKVLNFLQDSQKCSSQDLVKIGATLAPRQITEKIDSFEYDGWNMTYKYKAAYKGFEQENPLLLIHPVGIGLSSWFWDKFMDEWEGPQLIAIDLIGCGIHHGADSWDPDVRGLHIPLDWVRACEALMQIVAAEKSVANRRQSSSFPFLDLGLNGKSSGRYSAIVQGGLAPVGVQLAFRNPNLVDKLILTSPPVWQKMVTPVSEKDIAKNYKFFRSSFPGGVLFKLLETRWAIKFFSNLFLFAEPCDKTWLDKAMLEACEEARPPIQVFNAEFCFHRSYEEELCTLKQPVLILQGVEDVYRIPERQDYAKAMKKCTLQVLEGKNVLPWESPGATVEAVKAFLKD